jgi:hypothetical protein
VDFTPSAGGPMQNAASFAVHRQLAKIISVDLDKTFYMSGDSVNPRIVIRNVSNRKLQDLQVEFEPYTYPWIAPAPDEQPVWKKIVSRSLSLMPGEQREFVVENAATVQAGKEPAVIYYSVVIRDSRDPDHIYDLAFAPAALPSRQILRSRSSIHSHICMGISATCRDRRHTGILSAALCFRLH